MKKSYGQVKLYSVDTSSFYRPIEWDWQIGIMRLNASINRFEKSKKKYETDMSNGSISYKGRRRHLKIKKKDRQKITKERIKHYEKMIKKRKAQISYCQSKIVEFKFSFEESRKIPVDKMQLNPKSLSKNKQISIFESSLTRSLDLKSKELTTELFVVQVYHYDVFKRIIDEGFTFEGEKYVYYSSSAGQIRTKKLVFIRESIYKEIEKKLTCDLSVDEINRKGGINPNKYQAYLALTNSASHKWEGFDITKSIVVDDMETPVHGEFDNVDINTFEITREFLSVDIPHTDGCGMICPTVNEKSFMYRMPWHKGLLVPFDFKKFARMNNINKVKDIYGKEYLIDDVDVMFTKSQFKMWKYYSDWHEYVQKFIENECEAVMLNEEDVRGSVFLNYQMLQTLVDMTEKELKYLSRKTIEDIHKISHDKKTMLRTLGAKSEFEEGGFDKSPHQYALALYPELLNEDYTKNILMQKRKSLVKDAKAGKLRVSGHYTYLVPDLYAFCEFLFLGIENPKGLLENNNVYCSLFTDDKLQVLRSPHLYKEHCIRNNVKSEELSEWFITKGIYTSVHDTISRILQFDNDGDKALVLNDKELIKVAERNMEGVVPLYYEMKTSLPSQINSESIYYSLTQAYKVNIGMTSNKISKVWSSDYPNDEVVKWLTVLNNFLIDQAKTNFKLEVPKDKLRIISQYTKKKVPHFFMYAKNKEFDKVEEVNNSTVNKLENMIVEPDAEIEDVVGTFNYKYLLRDMDETRVSKIVVKAFTSLHRKKKRLMKGDTSDSYKNVEEIIYAEMKETGFSDFDIVNTLVLYAYGQGKTNITTTLWEVYGNVLYENLKVNLGYSKQCECCGITIKGGSNRITYCEDCFKVKRKEYKRIKEKERRDKLRGQLET